MFSARNTLLSCLILLVIGATARGLLSDRMQVEHFDEGVYASGFFATHLDHRYPDEHLYAPPLFPDFLEWSLIGSSGAEQAPLWLSVALGLALVGAVYGLAREWFDEPTARAAALLAATSEFAILF
ncbi:MAG: hypothetical protein KDA58_14730, partial [Planctomycetaceae bacterium]|nr:hypothetical protein [Planctomycetaceae bacterium]